MSRRDVLKGLTGLALTGCRRGVGGWLEGRRAIVGAIVGGAHRRGHRLREGFRPRPEATEDVGVAILGAGVAGLSAAWAFERAGFRDYLVLELEDVPGGTARSTAGTRRGFGGSSSTAAGTTSGRASSGPRPGRASTITPPASRTGRRSRPSSSPGRKGTDAWSPISRASWGGACGPACW